MKRGCKLRLGAAALLIALAGCTTYQRAPLPDRADLLPSVEVALSDLKPGAPRPHPIRASEPLDEETVAAIAVLNNPDLKAQRRNAQVADAQVFEAGLLPDPQLTVGLSRSPEHGGYDVGLAQEVQSILTRGARRAAARAQARQVNLDILWQEWQVAEKARELFIQLAAEPALRAALIANRQLLATRYERDQAAMRQNAATVSTVGTDATALADADAPVRELALQTNDADHALHALLGLRPDVPLRLGPLTIPPTLSAAEFQQRSATLAARRPDLLALRAGYNSEEENVRAAVLAQFPAVSLGADRARSAEEGVGSVGLSFSVTLPVFNRNRGRIAIERATREQLRAEYQARLDQAVNDADRLWKSTRLLNEQRSRLEADVAAMSTSAAAVDREFQAGHLTLDEYAALRPSLSALEISRTRVQMALAQAQSALVLVLGGSGALN